MNPKGLHCMQQWQRDEIARAGSGEPRLFAEFDRQREANRQAWEDHIARVNDIDKPSPVMPAVVVIIGAGMVAGLAVLIVPPIFNALFGLLTGWMG